MLIFFSLLITANITPLSNQSSMKCDTNYSDTHHSTRGFSPLCTVEIYGLHGRLVWNKPSDSDYIGVTFLNKGGKPEEVPINKGDVAKQQGINVFPLPNQCGMKCDTQHSTRGFSPLCTVVIYDLRGRCIGAFPCVHLLNKGTCSVVHTLKYMIYIEIYKFFFLCQIFLIKR